MVQTVTVTRHGVGREHIYTHVDSTRDWIGRSAGADGTTLEYMGIELLGQ